MLSVCCICILHIHVAYIYCVYILRIYIAYIYCVYTVYIQYSVHPVLSVHTDRYMHIVYSYCLCIIAIYAVYMFCICILYIYIYCLRPRPASQHGLDGTLCRCRHLSGPLCVKSVYREQRDRRRISYFTKTYSQPTKVFSDDFCILRHFCIVLPQTTHILLVEQNIALLICNNANKGE